MSALERMAARGTPAMMRAVGNMAYASICKAAGQRYVTRRIYDYKMKLDLHDPGISRALMLFGERELDHKIILEKYLKPGMQVFDIGGNIGYYPLLELQITKGMGQVIAFEPVIENAKLLRENLDLNGYWTVQVVNEAISDSTGQREFYTSAFSNLGTFNLSHSMSAPDYADVRGNSSQPVSTLSFIDACKKYGKPDLVRMDVEGHEVEILDNIAQSDAKPIIIFETHFDRYYYDHDIVVVLHRLFSKGFHCPLMSSANEQASKEFLRRDYRQLGYSIATDATYRSLFLNIAPCDAIDLICAQNGARTVVLCHD